METDCGSYGPRDGDRELIPAARNALPRLLGFAERAKKLLGEMEWSGQEPDFSEDYAAACPACRELKSPHHAHKSDCELAALIGKPAPSSIPVWERNRAYVVGDVVTRDGVTYDGVVGENGLTFIPRKP